MKTLSLIIICLLIFACNGEKAKNSLEINNLKGNINQITEYTYYSSKEKFGEAQKDSIEGKVLYVFDNLGNMIELNDYKSDTVLVEKLKVKYNESNHRIESVLYNANGNLKQKSISNYDKSGNEVERIRFNPDSSKATQSDNMYTNYKSVFQYNDKHELIFGAEIYSKFRLENEYLYDENGNLIEIIRTWINKSIHPKTISQFKNFQFDENGNWIRQNIYINDTLKQIRERKIQYLK